MRSSLISSCAILVFAAAPLSASITATLSGSVSDPDGRAVALAQISVVSTESGLVRDVQSDRSGAYSLPGLAPGRYRLEASANGFATRRLENVVLHANDALRLDIALTIGPSVQTIDVVAPAVAVDTANTQMGDVVSSRAIEALPLNGRAYTDLIALQAGVVPVAAGTLPGSITLGGSVRSGNVSIAGSRESTNAFEVNGGGAEEPRLNGTSIVPNLDSIAEFRIITTAADAEYGHYSGAVVNVLTKGGSNEFHGGAFEFFRNEKLDARNFFDDQRGRFSRNQFGGTLGGPVKRDRLFFFLDYQGTRETRGIATGDILVPSAAERAGDFSQTAATDLTGTVGGDNFASYLSGKLGYVVTSGEPYYVPGCVSSSACVFPNGIIPQRAFASPAKSLLPFIPSPSNNSVFRSSANHNVQQDDLGGFRVDLNNAASTVSLYGTTETSALWKEFGTNNVPGFPTSDLVRPRHINAAYIRTFGPRAVNELHLALTRYVVNTDHPDAGTGSGILRQLGFATGAQGGLTAAAPILEGAPAITFNDFSIGTPQFVYNAYETNTQVRDNFSLVKNGHTLKLGTDFEAATFVNRFPLLFGNGAFSFGGAETGNDFADFLIGAPTAFTQQSNADTDERKMYAGIYGEDSWKVSPSLTINTGLRWEYLPPFRERFNQKVTFVPGAQSSMFPTAPAGLLYVGDRLPGFGKIPGTISHTPLDDFAPRIGVAYSPVWNNSIARKLFGASGTSSIRASYGIYYTTIEGIGSYFGDPPVPFTTLYVAASPPYFANPYVDRATGTQHADPFPGQPVREGNIVDFGPFEPITGVPGTSIHNVSPYSEKYSVSFERGFGGVALLRLAYSGAEGHHLVATLPNNPGNPQQCLALSNPANLAPGSPVCGPFGEDTTYITARQDVISGTRSPFGGPYFGDNSDVATIANSSYNALETSVRVQGRHLTVLAAYTYSKSLDDSSGFDDSPLNPFDHRLSRSLSAFDVSQDLVLSYVYDLPFRHLSNPVWANIARGWKIAGISRFVTGLPVTVYENDDRSLLGLFGSGIGLFQPIDEPDYAGRKLKFRDPRSGEPYFPLSMFTLEPLGQLGTANRRFFHGPGIDNFDLSLIKDAKIAERFSLQFRAEFFNTLNHAQFLNPAGNMSDPANFGFVRSARDPRIGQLGIKLMF